MASDLVEYFRLVATEDVGCWINIHHFDGGPYGIPGSAHQTIRTAVLDCNYWLNRGFDVYMGQNVYVSAMPKHPRRPYPDAIRRENNLSMCRCLYTDVDVKEGSYASQEEALAAMTAFIEKAGLPQPTVMVSSGTGGIHTYWAMVDLFEPKEFRRRAAQLINAARVHGLSFDAQCTIDPVRLLRPPGTWNFKRARANGSDPLPVDLLSRAERIDNTAMWAALDQFSDVHVTPRSNRSRQPRNTTPDENDELIAGMGKGTFAPADIDAVAGVCPFIRNTLDTGGAELRDANQWHMVINLASFCKEPYPTAHRLCQGHLNYVSEHTDNRMDIQEQQKAGRSDIGPFTCQRIAHGGIPQCQSCPHLNSGTTPLLLPVKRINHTNYLAVTTDNDLPPAYYRSTDGSIHYNSSEVEAGTDTTAFPYPIIPNSGFLERGKPSRFTFKSKLGGGALEVTLTFPASCVKDKVTYHQTMLEEAMPIHTNLERSRAFMVAYLSTLQSRPETLVSYPAFGWERDRQGEMGFSYNGQFVSPSGVEKCARPPEGVTAFHAKGDDLAWRELAKVIITPERPDLAMVVAASFGAPLLKVLGREGLLLGVWASQSGIGKTTALLLGQAVWGLPVLGGMNDTVNYTIAKCAALNNLPAFYDEIKGEKQITAMCEIAFLLTKGENRGRLKRNSDMMEKIFFNTALIYASNASVVYEVSQRHRGTDADTLRMFEGRAIIAPNTEKHFISQISQLVVMMKENYGTVGVRYAEFLGKNWNALHDQLNSFQNSMQDKLDVIPEHRFWLAAVTTTLTGAYIANQLGVANFDLKSLSDYMFGEFNFMRDELAINPNDFSKMAAIMNVLGVFINDKLARNTLILDKTWDKPFRPPKDYAHIQNDRLNDSMWGAIEVQISGQPLTLRINDDALTVWCAKSQRPKSAVVNSLRVHFKARMLPAVLGSGSRKAVAPANVWILDPAGTPLEKMLEFTLIHKFLPP